MAIESPFGSDVGVEAEAVLAAIRARLPRILAVTLVLMAIGYLALPFIPGGRPASSLGPGSTVSATAAPTGDLVALQQQVTDADTKIANFKIANDFYPGTSGATLIDEELAGAARAIAAAEARRDTAQSNAALIRDLLAAHKPLDSIEDIRNSIAIQQLEQQKGQLTAQRAQLLATFLPAHPSIITATAQIASIDKQITIEAGRVADALDATVKLEASELDGLRRNLTALKAKQADATRNAVTLDALDRQAAAGRDALQSYLAAGHVASGGTPAAALPPASQGTGRNAGLIVFLIGCLALSVQIGAVVLGSLLSRPARDMFAGTSPGEPHLPSPDTEGRAEAWAVATPDAVDEVAVVPPPAGSQGLRKWFSRHAHAVEESPVGDEIALNHELAPEDEGAPDDLLPAGAATLEAGSAGMPISDGNFPEYRREAATADDADDADDLGGGGVPAGDAHGLRNLSSDLILGRASIVVLVSLGEAHEGELLAEKLASDALDHGLSVAHVDAGSQRPSSEPGLTDLAEDRAGYGDVVFKVQDGLAEIPWGHLPSLNYDSSKPATLVEALSDIYEVVLVAAGALGSETSMALFAGIDARLVLVGAVAPSLLEAYRSEALRLGFGQVDVLPAPDWRAQVA